MDVISETAEKGVRERRFEFKAGDELVPGIMWTPEDGTGARRPAILIGHGGTQHKRAPNVLALGRRFVRHLGYTAIAIDAPGHGDRITDQAAADEQRRNLEARVAQARREGRAVGLQLNPDAARAWVQRTITGVAEWKALLDDLDAAGGRGTPYGYWGVSMGTAIGLPFVASEPRISAAVLGLAGLGTRPGADGFEAAARSLRIPVLFLFQWGDELVSREHGLALFDALGSREKTLHINPGGHVEMPLFEREAAERFFLRHLDAAA